MMDITTILQQLVDTRFRDLAGLRISATVPVRDALINDLIGQVLASARSSSPAAASAAAGAAPGAPAPSGAPRAAAMPGLSGGLRIAPSDIAPLIRKVAVRAEQGRIVLDLEVAVD